MNGITFKKEYRFQCLDCEKRFGVAPSLFMRVYAVNMGAVNCPKCKRLILVYLSPDNKMRTDKQGMAKMDKLNIN